MTRSIDNMTSLLQERRVFPPPEHGRSTAHIADMAEYERQHAHSITDMEQFWAHRAEEVKGQAIYAYVTVNRNVTRSPELLAALRLHVRKEIGPIASPDVIQFAEGLPKTRSGKIMRRLLRKIAANDYENFGDISTLANPHVIEQLVTERKNQP